MPRGAKKGEYKLVQFKVSLTESKAIEIAEEAMEAGLRRKGQKVICAKEHGFAGEKRYNTQGLAKFLIFRCFPAWKDTKVERALALRKLQEDAKLLGREVV